MLFWNNFIFIQFLILDYLIKITIMSVLIYFAVKNALNAISYSSNRLISKLVAVHEMFWYLFILFFPPNTYKYQINVKLNGEKRFTAWKDLATIFNFIILKSKLIVIKMIFIPYPEIISAWKIICKTLKMYSHTN